MGQGTKKSSVILGSLIVVALAWASGCATVATPAPRAAGDVSFTVPFEAPEGAEVEASISGDGMDSPILADLEVSGGVARGLVDGVEAGSDRHIVVTAYDESGPLCSVSTTIDVVPELVTPVRDLTLECRPGSAATARREEALRDAAAIASYGYLER